MANSELYNKKFPIPENIIKHIKSAIISYPNSDGIKRAKFIVNNKHLTYQALKRIKNFFDGFDINKDNKERFELAGGELMKNFINKTLDSNRKGVELSKKNKQFFNVDPNLGTKPFKNPRLYEAVDIENKNAIIIIVNKDSEILLLKRSPLADWGASRWAFVGGSIQVGETPEKACKREVKEETGIILDDIINVFTLKRKNNTEFVFACRYLGDNNIKINKEHVDYEWFPLEDIKSLNVVPNLMDYLSLAFKNYNN